MSPNCSTKFSVIIPTYGRIEYLEKVLKGLKAQTRRPDEIVIGVRQEDVTTQSFLKNFQLAACPLKIAFVQVPGVVASMQAALNLTEGDIVCLLDDDAEPLPDWMERIESYFAKDKSLGAIGGKDLLQDYPEMRRNEPTTSRVGIITFYGQIIGNHHLGSGGFRYVDILKGCNVAVRGDLVRYLGLEQALHGQGAQVHWELALFLDIARAGWRIGYDPEIKVIHHIAPRWDNDQNHRGIFSEAGLKDMSYNEHFVMASRANSRMLAIHIFWSLLTGSKSLPGFLNYLRCKFYLKDPFSKERFLVARKGLKAGLKEGLAVRNSRRERSRKLPSPTEFSSLHSQRLV